MASYALLITLCGFNYSAVTHILALAPRIDVDPFHCFFSTANGWGTFALHGDKLEVTMLEGALQIEELHVTRKDQTKITHPSVFIGAGQSTTISWLP
jgi:hypothetical protein